MTPERKTARQECADDLVRRFREKGSMTFEEWLELTRDFPEFKPYGIPIVETPVKKKEKE